MTKEQALEYIRKTLESGDQFGKILHWDNYAKEPLRYPYFDVVMSLGVSGGHKLVRWHHFGSSANQYEDDPTETIDWIISNIFEMDVFEFLRKYVAIQKCKGLEYYWKDKQTKVTI